MVEQGAVVARLRSKRGSVLPMTLLLLACILLWGSVLLLTLSDGYAASNELVAREQSRLLACSGWNMALQQLEITGQRTALQLEEPAGSLQVSLQDGTENLIVIKAEAVSSGLSWDNNRHSSVIRIALAGAGQLAYCCGLAGFAAGQLAFDR